MEKNSENKSIKVLEEQLRKLSVLVSENKQNATGQYYPNLPMPKPIAFEGDVKANFKLFRSTWNNYLSASGLINRPEPEKIAVLLLAIGEKCFKLYENLPISEDEKKSSDNVLLAIMKYLLPEHNTRYERAVFNMAMQQ